MSADKILPTPDPLDIAKDARIVIVGAGCFGLSTAYHLLLRGYTDVTVLDRSAVLPAPDAASNDINRIVRSSYADIFYAELAREAISSWKDREKWGDSYHESGVLVLGLSNITGAVGAAYTNGSYETDVALGARLKVLENGEAIRTSFSPGVRTASFDKCAGYLNLDGGWADAGQSLKRMLNLVVSLKGKVLPGKQVSKLLRPERADTERGSKVECSDGTVLDADLLVIATGSWTPSAFPDLELGNICLATGQSIAMMQLSQVEADAYRDCPVILDFSTGFYIFPPNESNVVKMATNAAGYTHFGDNDSISTPRTATSDPETGLLIPKAALKDLRDHLREVYPDLAEKPFSATRLCWYNDTPDEDWVIGRHPKDPSIILATGDSGHAFKFLPVIGGLVADLVQNKLDTELVQKFAVDRQVRTAVISRSGQARRLALNELNAAEDLLA